GDFFEDFACGLGPDEGLWIGIVVFQVFHDRTFEFGDILEGTAADAVSGDLGKEALNHVAPRGRGRSEVQMEAWMHLEPTLYGRRFSGIVVNDQMQVEARRGLLVDQPEKAQELTMPMAWHARPDHLSVQHAECREQGRGA